MGMGCVYSYLKDWKGEDVVDSNKIEPIDVSRSSGYWGSSSVNRCLHPINTQALISMLRWCRTLCVGSLDVGS